MRCQQYKSYEKKVFINIYSYGWQPYGWWKLGLHEHKEVDLDRLDDLDQTSEMAIQPILPSFYESIFKTQKPETAKTSLTDKFVFLQCAFS